MDSVSLTRRSSNQSKCVKTVQVEVHEFVDENSAAEVDEYEPRGTRPEEVIEGSLGVPVGRPMLGCQGQHQASTPALCRS